MVSFTDVVIVKSGGCATAMRPVAAASNRQIQMTGTKRNAGCANVSMPATHAGGRAKGRTAYLSGLVRLLHGELLEAADPGTENPGVQ